MRLLSFTVAAVLAVCCISSLRASDECQDQCPMVAAARDAGASKEGVAKITKLRNEFLAAIMKLQESSEFREASHELAEAKKSGKAEAIGIANARLKLLTKPALEAFHKGAEDALGKETYAAFCKKLPDWAKV
jgi:hypothetical protein